MPKTHRGFSPKVELEILKAELSGQKRALECAHESTETLNLFAARCQDIIFRIRIPDGTYDYVSPSVTAMTGYNPEDCYRDPLLVRKVMPPEWQTLFDQNWIQAAAGQIQPFNEFPITHKSGHRIWCHQRNWLVWDERHEHPIALEGIVIDITETRRVQEALRSSEIEYRATADSLSDLLHVVDADLKIVLINQAGRAWLKSLGIETEPIGRTVLDLFPFLPDTVRGEYRTILESGKPLITEERTRIHGEEYVTETRKTPIVEAGKVMRIVTIVRDITKAVRAEEQHHQAEKLQALGQLAGGVAHDFNNQLTAVLGYAELLVQALPDPRLRGYAEVIAHTAARSSELTRRLLAFARKGSFRTELVDIHQLIHDVVALLERTIEKRIQIRQILEAPRSATLGDPVQLLNALLNLAINARDAMADGGVLSFSTGLDANLEESCRKAFPAASSGQFIRICVADTGVGMTPGTQQHIFEPFFTTKPAGQGTGLGLAAVYGTILSHHGAISVRSEPDRGSRFTLFLPLAGSAAATDARQNEPEMAQRSAHILIADDEESLRNLAATALTRLGYRVTTCRDGAEALEVYRAQGERIDLVILDMVMPSLSGGEAAVQLRKANPAVRILLITGHSVEQEARSLLDTGVAGLVQKPFHVTELAAAVAQALR